MNRKRMFFIVTVIFLCLGSAVPVFASAEEDFGNTDLTCFANIWTVVCLIQRRILFLRVRGPEQHRLLDDSDGEYAVRMLFEFASDGELSKVQVTRKRLKS